MAGLSELVQRLDSQETLTPKNQSLQEAPELKLIKPIKAC